LSGSVTAATSTWWASPADGRRLLRGGIPCEQTSVSPAGRQQLPRWANAVSPAGGLQLLRGGVPGARHPGARRPHGGKVTASPWFHDGVPAALSLG
jgi:hypothetical protein